MQETPTISLAADIKHDPNLAAGWWNPLHLLHPCTSAHSPLPQLRISQLLGGTGEELPEPACSCSSAHRRHAAAASSFSQLENSSLPCCGSAGLHRAKGKSCHSNAWRDETLRITADNVSTFSERRSTLQTCVLHFVHRSGKERARTALGENPTGADRFCYQSSSSLPLTKLSSSSSSLSSQTKGPQSSQVSDKPFTGTEAVPGFAGWRDRSLSSCTFCECLSGGLTPSLHLQFYHWARHHMVWNSPVWVSCVPSQHRAHPGLLTAGTEWEREEGQALCKPCSAAASTPGCYQHRFSHKSARCTTGAAAKPAHSIPARPSTRNRRWPGVCDCPSCQTKMLTELVRT